MKPPGKWHLARVGVLTALFGLGSGWMLFSRPGPTVVDVREASGVEVVCPDYRATTGGRRVVLPGAATCEVSASFPGGGAASGTVRVNSGETSVCGRSGDTLRCAP